MNSNLRFFIWAGFLGFIIIVIISAMIYFDIKQKRKLKELIKNQKERDLRNEF